MGLWVGQLMDVVAKQRQADLLKAAIEEMQKGQTSQSLMLFGMLMFIVLLGYVLFDQKSQAKKMQAILNGVREDMAVSDKERYQRDLELVQSTTEAIASFNAKFPDLMNFVRAQSSTMSELSPKMDKISERLENTQSIVASIKERIK